MNVGRGPGFTIRERKDAGIPSTPGELVTCLTPREVSSCSGGPSRGLVPVSPRLPVARYLRPVPRGETVPWQHGPDRLCSDLTVTSSDSPGGTVHENPAPPPAHERKAASASAAGRRDGQDEAGQVESGQVRSAGHSGAPAGRPSARVRTRAAVLKNNLIKNKLNQTLGYTGSVKCGANAPPVGRRARRLRSELA